jgi:hypothetical protein
MADSHLNSSRETPSAVHRRGTRVPTDFSAKEWIAVEEPSEPGLTAWIADLRDRLTKGRLADAAPVDLGYGTAGWPASLTIQIMLADLDHYSNLAPADRLNPAVGARRLELLDDFRRLRDVLG